MVDFSQEDLIEEDVMLLDANKHLFVWFGALSTRQEQQESGRIAREYLESCPNDRDPDTPVLRIKQGIEPPNFTGFFGTWDEERWDPSVLYSMEEEQGEAEVTFLTNGARSGGSSFYSYSVLTSGDLPDNVDPGKKEEFLTDSEFLQVLGMEKAAWAELPQWKRTNKKRELNLF